MVLLVHDILNFNFVVSFKVTGVSLFLSLKFLDLFGVPAVSFIDVFGKTISVVLVLFSEC